MSALISVRLVLQRDTNPTLLDHGYGLVYYIVPVYCPTLSSVLIPPTQHSCATLDPVSARMGDHLWVVKPSQYVTSQLGRLSLLPSVGW